MIRPRNIDPGQYPHPNALIFGSLLENAAYFVAAGTSLALATNPAGTFLQIAQPRPLPMAQNVAVTVAGTTTNGDLTLRIIGLNQFGEPVRQDFTLPSGTGVQVITPTAANITTKVFRKVTAVQVVSNANTAATTVSIGTACNQAQFKLGIPVKIAKVTETVRFQHFAAIAGANLLLGTAGTVDLTNHAIIPGAVPATGGTICFIQVDLNVNTGQRG